MNAPLNGVAGIPWANNSNIWSWISPAIELLGPWNLLIRVSHSQNYKTAISDKITCWEGEQFPLKDSRPTASTKWSWLPTSARHRAFAAGTHKGSWWWACGWSCRRRAWSGGWPCRRSCHPRPPDRAARRLCTPRTSGRASGSPCRWWTDCRHRSARVTGLARRENGRTVYQGSDRTLYD